jgi:hypothetical protein
MTGLSPNAQAIVDAYGDSEPADCDALAAALRVAAAQFPRYSDFSGMCCCEHLMDIARELDNYQPL